MCSWSHILASRIDESGFQKLGEIVNGNVQKGAVQFWMCTLHQGSPVPRPPTSKYLSAAQQEVSGGRASKAPSAAPHRSHYPLNLPAPAVRGKIVFHETGPWGQKGWGPLLSMEKGNSEFCAVCPSDDERLGRSIYACT